MSNVINGNVSDTGLIKGRVSGMGTLKGALGTLLARDGVSPVISVSPINGGHRLTIVDAEGTKTVDVMNGKDGTEGSGGGGGGNGNGISSVIMNADYTLTLNFDDGTSYTTPSLRGEKGRDGEDGTSVTVSRVSESTEDGGNNVVAFSDGKTVTVKNGSKGSKGEDGADGISPTVSVSKVGKITTIAITDKSGTKTATIKDGEDGTGGTGGGTGENGEDGIGIASIVQTTKSTEDDGVNIITVTLTDGSAHTFEVQNGSKGSNGEDGSPGKDGVSATHSWNGTVLTVSSSSGTSSADLKGETGKAGSDGTSVTVKSVSESSADGGSNVVTFSDGKTVTIKNGSKGDTGADGKDGADGNPGVYVGSGEMPDGYFVQIDPNGDPLSADDFVSEEQLNAAVENALADAVSKTGDTMQGALVAQNNTKYDVKQVRNVFLIAEGEDLPEGANGDICLYYVP